MNPKLSLVGAGPGDAELITVKGIRALQSADIVLYDALSAATLLDYVPEHAPTLYVGKRAGRHSYTQEQINDLIVDSGVYDRRRNFRMYLSTKFGKTAMLDFDFRYSDYGKKFFKLEKF